MADLTTHQLKTKFEALKPLMDEPLRRLWAAPEARVLGRGGITRVAQATGLSHVTSRAGLKEREGGITDAAQAKQSRRVRRAGGGRQRLTVHELSVLEDLEALGDPVSRGDPQSPLRWTCKSAANLAATLQAQGHPVSARTVITLLHPRGYSLPANRKLKEGSHHPDRNAQFQYINRLTQVFQRWGQAVVSVDTKTKELVGEFKNGAQAWQPQGQPESVRVYDFVDPDVGKAIPYGV